MKKIPYEKNNDHTNEMAASRRDFVKEVTGSELKHVGHYDFDPAVLPGNIESFMGVAQVPIGLGGPLLVNGEHAQGEFYIPLATSEGSLVASYSRGMKLLSEAGGVKCTVVKEAMQRSPMFVFEDARYARKFEQYLIDNFDAIKAKAEETTSSGKLINIEPYCVGKIQMLRFNYTTGDAAGQNMVTRATHKACYWMLDQGIDGLEHFAMSANTDTDKKHSVMNTIKTRGRKVVAEAVIPNDLMKKIMHTDNKTMFNQRNYSNIGSIVTGASNNGAHSANGLTAMFIATGQDVANVAESSAAIVFYQLRDNGDLYCSITIPSLIIATYGGGTGLPTQKECLGIMGCVGTGKVRKLAEIMAGVVLAGDLSLGAAVVANEWVSSHEDLGRNR